MCFCLFSRESYLRKNEVLTAIKCYFLEFASILGYYCDLIKNNYFFASHFLVTNLLLDIMKTIGAISNVERRIMIVSPFAHWFVYHQVLHFDKINVLPINRNIHYHIKIYVFNCLMLILLIYSNTEVLS